MTKSKTIALGILKAAGVICGIVLLAVFLYKIQSVIAYCAIAAVTALMGRPLVLFLRKRLKFNINVAVVSTLFVFLGIFAGVIWLLVPMITDQSDNFELFELQNLQTKLNEVFTSVSKKFGASRKVVNEIIQNADIETKVIKELEVGGIPKLLNAIMGLLVDLGFGLFSVLFISYFFLKDSRLIQKFILQFVPSQHRDKSIASIAETKNLLSRYFVGLLIQMAILFIFYSATLLIVGIENAMIIALVCALFNIIPYVGPLIGGGVMILLSITSNLDMDFDTVILPTTTYVLGGFVLGQLIDNFFTQPYVFSKSVRAHPLEIFLVIIIGGLLFGIIGMIVVVPTYTVLRVIVKQFGLLDILLESVDLSQD